MFLTSDCNKLFQLCILIKNFIQAGYFLTSKYPSRHNSESRSSLTDTGQLTASQQRQALPGISKNSFFHPLCLLTSQ